MENQEIIEERILDMNQIQEYLVYNYHLKNEQIEAKLLILLSKIKDEELKREIYQILGLAKGYTEYRLKNISEEIGLTKSRVKTLVKELVAEEKIKFIVENNLTFLCPIISP